MNKFVHRLVLPVLLGWSGITPVLAQELARVWRVCVSDAVVPPYLYNDASRPGIAERILMEAGREVGLSTVILRYPSARCRAMMEAGSLEALLAAPTPSNLEAFQFPMKAGALDMGRRLARVNLVWVKRADSPYEWNGLGMSGGSPGNILVGTRSSLLIAIEPLKKLGFKVDPATVTTLQLLLKLELKRVDIALALQEEVEFDLQDPRLHGLVVLPKAFSTAVYFVAVRQGLPPETQKLVDAWWNAIGRLREAPEYRVH